MKKEQFQKFNIIITLLGIFIFGIFIFPNNAFAVDEQVFVNMVSGMVDMSAFDTSVSFGIPQTAYVSTLNQGYKDTYPGTANGLASIFAIAGGSASFDIETAYGANGDGDYWFIADEYLWDGNSHGNDIFVRNVYVLFNRTAGVWSTDTNYPPTGITSSYPADQATNVNASTTFTGTYSNAGLYDKVAVEWKNLDQYSVPTYYKLCQDALVGADLDYTCNNVSLSTNTNYQFNVYLCDSDALLTYGGTLENSCIEDTSGPYVFTTGLVYAVQDTPTSAECATFDVGCYLENALGWFFGVSQATLNNFGNLTLRNSIPFSYLYDLDTLYEKLFLQDPEDINIVIPFGSGSISVFSTDQLKEVPFQALVRTVMGAIMIFGTTMTIYRRVIKIHDFGHKTV